jgi:uncharacterized membrane-anchored protein
VSTLDLRRVRTWIARALAARRHPTGATDPADRGDVPGWVLVTIMTAGLVVGLWAIAGPRLEAVFTSAMDAVVGQL